jgi:tetraacyldisaccharide 4'-kinase
VEKLARTLHANGRKVAILSRGYKSKREPLWRRWWRQLLQQQAPEPRVVSDGRTIFHNSEIAGDEPYMLACNLPGVLVITDKDRVKAGQFAIRKYGVDTLILDDGFQYYQLQDHLQLLLIDKTNPFGNGHLLPRGILREPVSQMRRASYVFLTKSEDPPDAQLLNELHLHRDETNWIECSHRPKYLQAVYGDERQALEWIKGRRVGAMSGIAAPESFEKFVRELGAQQVVPYRFLDHHRFTADELQRVALDVEKQLLDVLITTEKDAVRLPMAFAWPVPVYYLRVEIHLLEGADSFEQAVRRICFPRTAGANGRWQTGLTRPPFSSEASEWK